ncbi:NACHT, LRR and PYD domains-containing protein 12-like [Pocillopora verrucosa]|uniref:NACHT, LRR and PYD domains-containing protein 12-like n=1 Tax=Pocillopora verrucosa TaxID=203993 RepID=UPI00334282BD
MFDSYRDLFLNTFHTLQALSSVVVNLPILKPIETISRYTKYLQASVLSQTEFQPKLLASRTISNAKTDEIFTNLLIQHGRKALTRKDETYYSRSEELKYYGKVSGTPVKYSSEIFLGVIDDQESASSILVVGKAGIGKSLFCQKVIRDWANNELFQARENTEIPNLKFVYLLSFRQLNLLENNCVTLREILNWSSVLDDKCNIDDSTFEYIVKHPKQVMIILDGFDEYSQQNYIIENLEAYPNDAKGKMPVAALCSKLIKGKILRGAIVMITSRPDESDKMGGMLFKRYVEIVGFSSGQVKEYIEKYFKDNENMKNAVLKHVMNNSDLVSFAHIPMLCYLLCFEMEYTLTESGNPDDLPVSTTDIYTKLVDIFELKHCAESEYRQKEIPEQFEPPSVIKNTLEKLSKLAAKLLLERKPTFDESEMEGNFEAEEVNKLKGSGLLYCGQPFRTASITTTKHFSFTHLTVQEFLAARWFVKENCVPDEKCSKMFYQFMAGVLSSEGNDELMDKLLDSRHMNSSLKMKCLIEYQNKEFAKKFIKNNPLMFSNSLGFMFLHDLSDEKCIEVSFVLDIISELNKEEAGEAQHKCSDKFVTVKKLEIRRSLLTLSGIQRFCNSLNNEHCLVSELVLCEINLSEYVSVLNRLVRKLTTLYLESNRITDSGVASLCEALQHPSCRLTRLELDEMKITKNGFASLGEALQHPSCKLTTLYLRYISITDTTVASLCKALQHPSCKLTTLYLGHNSLTDISAASLCKALQHPSCKLTSLNLMGNSLNKTDLQSNQY